MDLRQLASFVETASAGSYAGAARRLQLAQPAVWKHVHNLETELDVALFTRAGRGVKPTLAGRALLARAEQLLQSSARFGELARDLRTGHIGLVSIGCVAPEVIGFLGPILGAFQRQVPNVRVALVDVDIHNRPTTAFREALRSGSVDVLVGPRVPDTDSFAIGEGAVVCAVPRHHPWVGWPSVRIAELNGVPLLVAPLGHFSREVIERECRAAGFEPQIALESDSPSVLIALGEEGLGVPIVGSDSAPCPSPAWPSLIAENGPLRSRTWCSADAQRDPATNAFFQLAREFASEQSTT